MGQGERGQLACEVRVVVGTAAGGIDDVSWRLSLRANPHLMLVGLPGMGKTTCLINICVQLGNAGIAPILFSYHDDIDEKLQRLSWEVKLIVVRAMAGDP